ncbi:MAG: hypothetical protein JF610_09450, partial [Acidobacteria bacterium]|nr:hypothetical protein [Acidobacteriota bacterium]
MAGRFGWRGIAVAAAAAVVVVAAQQPTVRDARENAYRANNVGVALLEQFNYAAAADAFRRALSIERSLPLTHL